MHMFTVNVSRKVMLGCGCAAAALLAQSAAAQSTASANAPLATATAAAADATPDREIIVIGTRRTDRSITDSASPIDVIGGAELAAQPASDLLDVIKNLVPSFYVPQNTISDASSFVRAPSLRGLAADEVLVMINGKRYNRSALVQVYTGGDTALSFGSQGADISLIPTIAISNVQILRDGATAQYGSDAIAGVINYGLRSDAGFELQGRYGQTYEGDGKSYQIAGYGGVKLGSRGFISVSGEYFDDGQTSRGKTRPIAVVFAQANPGLASQLPNYPGPVQIWGSSPAHGYKFVVNSSYEIFDDNSIYFSGNLANKKADESFNYRSPFTLPGTVVADSGSGPMNVTSAFAGALRRNGSFAPIYLTRCPTGNATCPTGSFVKDGNTFSFASVYPAGFTPRFQGEVDQAYGTLGWKGSTDGGFTYDLSGTLSRNSLDLAMTNSLSASYGPASQTSFKFGKLIQREIDVNLDLTYPIEVGFASPITLSGGAEYRREEYQATAGDEQSYGAGPYAAQRLYVQTAPGVYAFDSTVAQSPGASGYGGTSPASAKKYRQSNYGIYLGAETDIVEALTVGVAGRYEHYNTFGGAFVGKANALYRVSDMFSLRGTFGTGFHAPSPGQNNVQILTTNFVSGNQVQTGTYPVSSAIAQYYGARSLKPEKSTNFGAGFIVKPADAFTVTVDGYIVKVRNRIGITQNFTVTAADVIAQPALAAVGVGGVVNYFTNGFDTRTGGIDAVASYRTGLFDNPLSLTLAYAYNKSKVTKAIFGTISEAQKVNIAHLSPNHRLNLSANYQIEGFTINGRTNFYSSWRNETDYPYVSPPSATAPIPRLGQKFGSKFTQDLDLSYTFAEHFTLTVGGYNIFNEHPDKLKASPAIPIYALTDSTGDGQVYPRTGGPFGINGGFWYVRVRVKY